MCRCDKKRSRTGVIIPNIFLMPLVGPAALEAIANGAVFLNPKFTPPHGRGNTEFFLGKPTSRNLTSQHPYAEEFVNKSAVVTVDIGDLNAVKEAVKRIVNSKVLFSFA